MDLQQFYMGNSFDAYRYFGVHPEGEAFVFRTYAPNASRVSVTGEFTNWQEAPLTQLDQSGVWISEALSAQEGQMYKYCIYGPSGRQEHCDPYGFGMELRPGACSVIRRLDTYQYHDAAWMKSRTRCFDQPLHIYELHMGSWKKPGAQWPTYLSIADELISYLKSCHYTHVEFMPLSEHPFDGSWGYQNTGFYAPTSRYGTAEQLMTLIDQLHQAGIGAILDFVPVHFAIDSYGLRLYDGTPLYEYPHQDVGISEWGSCNFNHSRREVACFLQSAANYWLTEYHFDGLRMDAVSRLIYWQGDEHRGENTCAIQFLQTMNQGLHARHPAAMLIAEDSTAFPGVTKPVEEGGLGFDYKWDFGWMHDTLQYFQSSPYDRARLSAKITFPMFYHSNERYLLPFSHDETVHGKKTIINKLFGSYEEKFAQAKLLAVYMLTHPGKKLSFMGNELAMFREWDERRELDWDLLGLPAHASFHLWIKRLNAIYLTEEALWSQDDASCGFQWIDCQSSPCVFAYQRNGKHGSLLILLNFSDSEAAIEPDLPGEWELLLDSSLEGSAEYTVCTGIPDVLPAYTGMILRKIVPD